MVRKYSEKIIIINIEMVLLIKKSKNGLLNRRAQAFVTRRYIMIGLIQMRLFCSIYNFNELSDTVSRLYFSTEFRQIAEARSSIYYAKEKNRKCGKANLESRCKRQS